VNEFRSKPDGFAPPFGGTFRPQQPGRRRHKKIPTGADLL
jgi:hypothetical protein